MDGTIWRLGVWLAGVWAPNVWLETANVTAGRWAQPLAYARQLARLLDVEPLTARSGRDEDVS